MLLKFQQLCCNKKICAILMCNVIFLHCSHAFDPASWNFCLFLFDALPVLFFVSVLRILAICVNVFILLTLQLTCEQKFFFCVFSISPICSINLNYLLFTFFCFQRIELCLVLTNIQVFSLLFFPLLTYAQFYAMKCFLFIRTGFLHSFYVQIVDFIDTVQCCFSNVYFFLPAHLSLDNSIESKKNIV